jgi:MFS family permease
MAGRAHGGRATATATGAPAGRRGVMLALATVGFLVNFWAWALISPLGVAYREELGLTAFEQALLVAVPVVVGSVGRIPVGALTDRLGARVMFPAVSFLTVLPVLFVGLFGDSYPTLLLGGFFLGIGGTAFAVGVPLVNAWYPPARRGLALGVFGMGMGGTAVSAFTTVQLAARYGRAFPFLLVAVVLVVYGVVAALLLRDAAGRTVPTGSFLARTWATLRMRATLQLSALYAVGFGGFVAFSVYLPTYLKQAYGLTQADAALRTAGFVVLAVVMRPTGGVVLRPVPPGPRADGVLRRGGGARGPRRRRVPAHAAGHGRVPRPGRDAGCGVGCHLRTRRQDRIGREGRGGDGRGRCGRWAGRVRPAAGDGRDLRRARRLQRRAAAARRRRGGRRHLHLARPAPRGADGMTRSDRSRKDPHVTTHANLPGGGEVGMDGGVTEALLRTRRFLDRSAVSDDLRTLHQIGGRDADTFYRDRWSHDKVVRSTHGVNCTGSCSWKVYVKDGIITWEAQQTDYPTAGPDRPEYEPRGCPRGAAFSWYTYSPTRVRYPYVRGSLLQTYRVAKAEHGDPVAAWASIVDDPDRARVYKSHRGHGGLVRASWGEATELVAAAHVHTIKRYGPDRIAGFSPIPAMSMVSHAAGARFVSLIGGAMLSFYD